MEIETATLDDITDMMRSSPVETKVELIRELLEQLWNEMDATSNRDAWNEMTTARQHVNYLKEYLEVI